MLGLLGHIIDYWINEWLLMCSHVRVTFLAFSEKHAMH